MALWVMGCANNSSTTTSTGQIIEEVTVTEAYNLIQDNSDKAAFFILDVRTPSEFASGHIEGSILIDFNASNFRTEVDKLDKSKRYLVYCRTSNRSGQAVSIMKDLGFKEVYDVDGGIVAWEAAGLPIVT
ncbi:rhodanese-like protein [Dehalogenimonas sp. WBC-2]|nr:rhodanese-like protein [Dehalogenimonas sp. WBC-2]